MVLALNTISGQIADVSPKLLEHPKFKDVLQVVEPDAKPYVAELYKGGTKTEKAAKKTKQEEPIIEDVEVITDEEDVVETVISETEEDN